MSEKQETPTTSENEPNISLVDGAEAAGDKALEEGKTTINGEAATSWRDSLPADLRDDPSLATIPDVANLAKSLIHAQKAIGADKIVLPSKHATEEDWQKVFNKLGLPEDIKDYKVNTPKDVEDLDDGFINSFKESAHKAGILPQQAQKILDWYGQSAKGLLEDQTKQFDQQKAQDLKALREDWGKAFDQNMRAAKVVLQEFGDAELLTHLQETGMHNDPKLVKFLSKVGMTLREDSIKGGVERHDSNIKDPDTARREIAGIQGDKEHPYWKKDHPNHKAAVEEMQSLFQMANPT